jgi:serine/threonine protein kinase/Tfp pilus assembly protein PilF
MSEVYLAEDTRLKRPVALKVLREKYSEDELSLKRFQQEAFAASALNHPHIVTVYDIGYEAGTHFIATEFVQGEPLRKFIERGPLTVDNALDFALQVGDALAAAHRAQIIHRDVKPENIIVGPDQHLKLLDFGIAKLLSRPSGSTLETLPGILIGTPIYMSPEQARGDVVSTTCDVWSLGVVLYEMLAGKPPFTGTTVNEVMRLILESEPVSLSSLRPDVSQEVSALLKTAIAKQAAERFEDAAQLVQHLKQVRESNFRKPADSLDAKLKTTVQDVQQSTPQPTSTKRQQRKTIKSIAILPFRNESSYDMAEYLSDGVTETIINKLSQLPQLRVLSRNSVFAFKGSSEDPIAIGKRLGVAAVVTGRLLRVDSKLRVSTELVNVANGFQMWGDHFSRTIADIFEIQEEIAREISEKLEVKLSPRQRKNLEKRHTLNEHAYLSYLKGRFQWNKRSAEGLKLAVDHFSEAIGLEPLYALAHAGLADTYVALGALHALPSREAYSKARAAAMQALEIDSGLAEAYATLGFVMATLDRNWSGSEQAFEKALSLNSSYATAHQWYSVVLRSLGRFDQAIEESQKAQELDPLSPIINATVGQCFYFARRYDEAIKLYRRMLAVESNYRWTHYLVACALREKGWYKEAIAEFEEALRLMPGEPVVNSDLAYTFALSGRKEDARLKLTELEQQSRSTYVSPYDLAIAYLGLGDKEAALTLLEQAHIEHDDGLLMIRIDPLLDILRTEDRFRAILQQVGLD